MAKATLSVKGALEKLLAGDPAAPDLLRTCTSTDVGFAKDLTEYILAKKLISQLIEWGCTSNAATDYPAAKKTIKLNLAQDPAVALDAIASLIVLRLPSIHQSAATSIPRLLVFLEQSINEPAICSSVQRMRAVQCLEALSTCPGISEPMVAAGVPNTLRKLLSLGVQELLFHVVATLHNVIDSDRSRHQLCCLKLASALTRIVADPSNAPEIKEVAVMAVYRMAGGRPGLKEGAILPECLVHMAASPLSPEMRFDAILALHILSERPELRERLRTVVGLHDTLLKGSTDPRGDDVASLCKQSLINLELALSSTSSLRADKMPGDDWTSQYTHSLNNGGGKGSSCKRKRGKAKR